MGKKFKPYLLVYYHLFYAYHQECVCVCEREREREKERERGCHASYLCDGFICLKKFIIPFVLLTICGKIQTWLISLLPHVVHIHQVRACTTHVRQRLLRVLLCDGFV